MVSRSQDPATEWESCEGTRAGGGMWQLPNKHPIPGSRPSGWAQNIWNGTHLSSAAGNGSGVELTVEFPSLEDVPWRFMPIYLFIFSFMKKELESSDSDPPHTN